MECDSRLAARLELCARDLRADIRFWCLLGLDLELSQRVTEYSSTFHLTARVSASPITHHASPAALHNW